MTFKPYNATQIAAGRADDQYLFDLARRNFADHESRLLTLEGGTFVVGATVAANDSTITTSVIGSLASVQITTSGRPVMVMACAKTTAAGGVVYAENTSAAQNTVNTAWRISREDYNPSPNLVEAIRNLTIAHTNPANGVFRFGIPCSIFCAVDRPAAGTFVYHLIGLHIGTNMKAGVENISLCAIELP